MRRTAQAAEPECALSLRFDGKRLRVAGPGGCGFGLDLSAAGRYRRGSRAEPRFGHP